MAEAKDPHADIAALSFEAALAELNQVVERLEGGEAALEESISLYERGEALRRHCEAQLDQAELKVEKIVQMRDTAPKTTPFDAE